LFLLLLLSIVHSIAYRDVEIIEQPSAIKISEQFKRKADSSQSQQMHSKSASKSKEPMQILSYSNRSTNNSLACLINSNHHPVSLNPSSKTFREMNYRHVVSSNLDLSIFTSEIPIQVDYYGESIIILFIF
jgi:bacillopeptidase F (M6 metalloprotease family)